jgi:predicted small metal-binding protein
MHDFTGFEPVENTVDDVSRVAQEGRLDEVRAEDVTHLLDSHGQQRSNEDLKDTVKELSQQEEEKEKVEDSPEKYMETSDL